jgi:hypothetical protein
LNPVEPSADSRGLALLYKQLFVALLEQEFTRTEAMEILIAFIEKDEPL